MPTYPVKHTETGETKELSMTMKEYDQWRQENPEWDKDWSQGAGGVVSGVGDVYSVYDGTLVVPYLCPVSAAPIHMHNTLTEYLSIPV